MAPFYCQPFLSGCDFSLGSWKKCFTVSPLPSVCCSLATLYVYNYLWYLIKGFKWTCNFFFSCLNSWQGWQQPLQRFSWRAARLYLPGDRWGLLVSSWLREGRWVAATVSGNGQKREQNWRKPASCHACAQLQAPECAVKGGYGPHT